MRLDLAPENGSSVTPCRPALFEIPRIGRQQRPPASPEIGDRHCRRPEIAAYGVPGQTYLVRDGVNTLAALRPLVNRCIPQFALGGARRLSGRAARWSVVTRWRRRSHRRHTRTAQIGMVPTEDVFDGITDILDQVKPIRNLDGLRRTLSRAIGIGTGPVTAHDFNPGMGG